MEQRPVPLPLLSSFSLPACQVIATLGLLLLEAAGFLQALLIRLGWEPHATKLREAMKKTPPALSCQLGAGGRAGSGLTCLPGRGASSLQPPPRALEEGLWGRRAREKEEGFASWPLPRGPVEIFRERKRCILSTASSLLLPETWSRWFSPVRTASCLVMPLRYFRSHPHNINTRRTLIVSRH